MKTLYITIAALSLTAFAAAANAETTEMNYDVKNTANLQNQSGFEVMGFKQPSVRESYGQTVASQNALAPMPASPEQLNAIESAAGPAMAPQVPAAPQMPTPPNTPDITWNDAEPVMPEGGMQAQTQTQMQMQMQPQNTQPQAQAPVMMAPDAQAQEAYEMGMTTPAVTTNAGVAVVTQPEAPTMPMAPQVAAPEAEGQTVITTHKIIGKTDTGVDPQKVLNALENKK